MESLKVQAMAGVEFLRNSRILIRRKSKFEQETLKLGEMHRMIPEATSQD
jgi:hypothetical protein